jgi:hypothetical protein
MSLYRRIEAEDVTSTVFIRVMIYHDVFPPLGGTCQWRHGKMREAGTHLHPNCYLGP